MGWVYSKSGAAPAAQPGAASAPPSEPRGASRFLAEARRLFALLGDGAPAAGYHIRRGLALRDADSKRPLLGSYTETWRPARERLPDGSEIDRRLNPFVLRQHLLGKYDVAWQAPSWTSLVVFDIDRPEIDRGGVSDPAIELAADSERDRVLAALWDAFGFDRDKQPVVLRSPGGGYHVYLPLLRAADASERTWPAAWAREHIEHLLDRHGLDRRPGRLELFPSGIRLRAPCGAGSALLVPDCPDFSDDLRLRLTHARWRPWQNRATGANELRLVRDIGPLVTGFCDAVEAARRPLEEWLGRSTRCWHPVWGPWGREPLDRAKAGAPPEVSALSQHKEEVPTASGRLPSSPAVVGARGWLLYGAVFRSRVRDLAERGLVGAGERHDAALKLTWYWGKCRGLDRSTTLGRVREWLTSFEHASATRERSRHAFVRDTLREVAHYYDHHVVPAGRGSPRGVDIALRPLSPADRSLLAGVASDLRPAVEIVLRYLRGASGEDGWVPHPVNLSSRVLALLLGERRVRVTESDGAVRRRRVAVMTIEELTRLGILALHTDYSTGHHGRLFTCWYRFGSGALPAAEDGWRVLASREIEEGRISVIADGSGEVVVRLEPVGRAGAAAPADDPWWVRMYRRRAFTPAEFFEGDRRSLIPGPFRHRRRAAAVEVAGDRVEGTPSGGPGSGPSAGGSGSGAAPALPCPPAVPAGVPPGAELRRGVEGALVHTGGQVPAAPAARVQLAADEPLGRQIERTWRRWLERRRE
jgi:hypothetical protein